MNAAQLIEALMDLHPDTEVWYDYYDSDGDKSFRCPITGVDPDGMLRDWEIE